MPAGCFICKSLDLLPALANSIFGALNAMGKLPGQCFRAGWLASARRTSRTFWRPGAESRGNRLFPGTVADMHVFEFAVIELAMDDASAGALAMAVATDADADAGVRCSIAAVAEGWRGRL